MLADERQHLLLSQPGLGGLGAWGKALFRIWGFPKIGDPNIVPQIVGSIL